MQAMSHDIGYSSFLLPKISMKCEQGTPMGAPNTGGVGQNGPL